jgi:polysaccharide export outer membrane protein
VNDQDKIFVAPPKTFHIYGQVNAPGSYPISHNMTIQMALARSGGLTALGSEKQIKLTRGDQEIKKPKLSEQIRPDDVLVVGERFF